ncbi:MAG: helix-turn-helix transcriptional regulator [Candidatus Omnitrophica bacterium]|nr:helix-turn-helix transcriptional regulator [Candidatus Omnitrophota bacterium]
MAGTSRALVAGRLRALRGRYGYTQQAVAEKSRLDYKYYQRIEGKRPPNLTVDSLERLANVFGLGPSELLQLPPPPLASYARDAVAAQGIQRRLARRLRTLRRQAEWTPTELATRTGLTPRRITQAEDPASTLSMSLGLLERIAKAFGLSLSQLLDV